MATMTFARRQDARHLMELAAFSLPALIVALLLLGAPLCGHDGPAPPLQTSDVPAVADTAPLQSVTAADPTVASPVPQVAPEVKSDVPPLETKPYEGLGPTAFGRDILVQPNLPPAVPHEMTVRAGNSLWAIARQVYGNGRDFVVIFSANRATIAKPDLIHPGQHLVLPDKKAN